MILPVDPTDLSRTCVLRYCLSCGARFASHDPRQRHCAACTDSLLTRRRATTPDDGEVYAEPEWLDNPELPCPPRMARGSAGLGWRAWLAVVAGLICLALSLAWICR